MPPDGPPRAATVRATAPVLFAATVLAQIVYPLVHGGVRDAVTVTVVLLAAAAALADAAVTRGRGVALAVALVTAGGGFVVELVGVHTGHPFGHYDYAGSLGPRLDGVAVVVPFAWTMMAWPAAIVARRLVTGRAARVVVGAWALAAWDLFLDPQMVDAGHWHWSDVRAHLPGVPDVPLSNVAGWCLVALVMSALLHAVLDRAERTDRTDRTDRIDRTDRTERTERRPVAGATPTRPTAGASTYAAAFYVWTWASSTLALGAFLGLPAAAGWGALGMGVVAVPLVAGRRLHRRTPHHRRATTAVLHA